MSDLGTIAIATAFGTVALTEAVKTATKELSTQALKGLSKGTRRLAEATLEQFRDKFSDYLNRQYEKHFYIPTIVFQNNKPLEQLYVPLTVVTELQGENGIRKHKVKLNIYHPEFVPRFKKILITDSAGMGKSTLLRFLMLQSIKTKSTTPIFVVLRHLSQARTVVDYLLSELNPLDEISRAKFDRKSLANVLRSGGLTFFLDGYDEVPIKEREAVTQDIKRLIEEFPDNHYVISSRPENALAAFAGFQQFSIESLQLSESFLLIRKYDGSGTRSEQLIKQLETRELENVKEFLKNPLLTTLLYRCYEYKNQIPLRKPAFYRQVYDALYDWHDATKDGYNTREKVSKLDIDNFHKILRALGFVTTLIGKVEGDADEFLGWVRQARTYARELSFSESDFLDDAIKAVPVLCKEGNSFKWAHKSLAEYFCAQFIVTDLKQDQGKVLKVIAESPALPTMQNVLDLLYDIDLETFHTYFLLPLALRLKIKSEEPWVGLDPRIPVGGLRLRIALTFARSVHVLPTTKKNFTQALNGLINGADEVKVKLKGGPKTFVSASLYVTSNKFPTKPEAAPITVMSFDDPLHTVINVLKEKRDPLFIPGDKLLGARAKSALAIGRAKGAVTLNRDPNAPWNSKRNFELVNNSLIRLFGGAIDYERLHDLPNTLSRRSTALPTDVLLQTFAQASEPKVLP